MSGSEKEAILQVFGSLIRPLMRAAFHYGITAAEIASVVRRTYIQALETRLAQQHRPATDARLAIVAGLPRTDVSALRAALENDVPHSTKNRVRLDQIGRLLTAWHTHPKFSGAYGIPIDLDLKATPGSPHRNFQQLIDTVCPEVEPEELVDELLTSGSAEIINNTTLRCISRSYVPATKEHSHIDRMSRFLDSLVKTVVHNLLRSEKDPVFFERTVFSDLPMSDVKRDRFFSEAKLKSESFLYELDNFLNVLGLENDVDSEKKYGVGIYFFERSLESTDSKQQLF
jgi:hypothetical protein